MTISYDFRRYLHAKQSVDDRALNKDVFAHARALARSLTQPMRVIEVGGGIGTMFTRLIDWELLTNCHYVLIDHDETLIAKLPDHLNNWADARAMDLKNPAPLQFVFADQLFLTAIPVDILDAPSKIEDQADLLIAHAVLDLLDLPAALEKLFQLVRPGGYFYFTINYDGETVFEPVADPAFESQLLKLYNQSMDDRMTNNSPSGDCRAGRHLFNHLPAAGAEILAAGSSDWVVFPVENGYESDEAYFLQHILHFFESTLTDHADLDQEEFEKWLSVRRKQIERGQLTYIAHQIDFLGKAPG
jgi:SAM-dependent methyltransferase